MLFDRLLASDRSSSSDRNQTALRRIAVFFRHNKQWLILILASLLLLLFLIPSDQPEEAPSLDFTSYSSVLRHDLEALLSDLNGVGRCSVFITFSDGGETVYAYDEDRKTDGDDLSENKEYVLISSRSQGLVLKVYPPSVLGVAVICQGGDSTRVKNDVTEILSRTLGISADRISVKKMTS